MDANFKDVQNISFEFHFGSRRIEVDCDKGSRSLKRLSVFYGFRLFCVQSKIY